MIPLANRYSRKCLAPLLALFISLAAARGARIDLRVHEPADPTSLPLAAEASVVPSDEVNWLVFGRFSGFDFAVADLANLRILDGAGNAVKVTVETPTVFREFDEIIAVTLAFELDPRTLAKGNPSAEWGPEVQGNISLVDAISFPENAFKQIQAFTPDAGGSSTAEATQFATIEIIADSQADKYYLWYLLPMAVIFVLLLIRKRWTS